ncbi:MAG: hypothetical protein JWO04_1563 [Gammaproteobacteria bacterium]|jgi:hypothetical protein|nr:hypothetical protein [Gammaproteobacteria bacterium]
MCRNYDGRRFCIEDAVGDDGRTLAHSTVSVHYGPELASAGALQDFL